MHRTAARDAFRIDGLNRWTAGIPIGNPFGLSGTMTRASSRQFRSLRGPSNSPIEDAIQTDAAVNPGNSEAAAELARRGDRELPRLIANNGARSIRSGIGFEDSHQIREAWIADLRQVWPHPSASLDISNPWLRPDIASKIGHARRLGV